MHSETMVLGCFVDGLRMPVPYKEMCLYNGYRWVAYISAQNNNSYSDPGFIFSVVLN